MIFLIITSKNTFIQFFLDVHILLVLAGSEALVPNGGTLARGKIHSHGSMQLEADTPPPLRLRPFGVSLVTEPTGRGGSITSSGDWFQLPRRNWAVAIPQDYWFFFRAPWDDGSRMLPTRTLPVAERNSQLTTRSTVWRTLARFHSSSFSSPSE